MRSFYALHEKLSRSRDPHNVKCIFPRTHVLINLKGTLVGFSTQLPILGFVSLLPHPSVPRTHKWDYDHVTHQQMADICCQDNVSYLCRGRDLCPCACHTRNASSDTCSQPGSSWHSPGCPGMASHLKPQQNTASVTHFREKTEWNTVLQFGVGLHIFSKREL